MNWEIFYAPAAQKDAKKLAQSHLKSKVQNLLDLLRIDPFVQPPPYEKLVGDLQGIYSRRINIQHRLVYSVDKEKKLIKVLRMWTHYE